MPADVFLPADEVAALVREHAEPFTDLDAADLDPLLDRLGRAEVVCLGEATHGTHEFYALRERITRRLVAEHGFRIVAAEADWPDMERVDAWVRHRDRGEAEWEAFARFPGWMWRNREVAGFVEWLREWNRGRPLAERAGMYGLDLYSLYTSLGEVVAYLGRRAPDLAEAARERYARLLAFSDPAEYGRAAASGESAEAGAVAMLRDLFRQRLRLTQGAASGEGPNPESGADADSPEATFPFFDAAQNARVVRDAEAYYRAAFRGDVSTWNLRDAHMMVTLQALRAFTGGAKAVVWAHNSHLGDAAATAMGARGEINLGHLCRREWGDAARLVGFGTHAGTVFAADGWGADGRVKTVRPSHEDSVERACYQTGVSRFALPLREAPARLRGALSTARLERMIGVIYRPETELQSHYAPAILPDQFDDWLWLDETRALEPLGPSHTPDLPRAHPFRLLAD